MAKKQRDEAVRRYVNFHQPVHCACNGQSCNGECRETNLQNNRTGVCVSAYNPTLNKDKRIPRDKGPEEYRGVFGEW